MFKATHLWLIPFVQKYLAVGNSYANKIDEPPYLVIELEQIGPCLYRDDMGIEFSFPPSGILRKGKLEKL